MQHVLFFLVPPWIHLVVSEEMNWPDARDHAESLSRGRYAAHLVTLETEGENDFVANLAKSKGIPRASWIGCSDESIEGEWRWLTGDLVSDGYEGWNPGEPSDGDGGEDFGEIGWHVPSTWNDGDGLGIQGFTVEFEPGEGAKPVKAQIGLEASLIGTH